MKLGMLTRLARLETRDNFSLSRIVFLAVENLRLLDHMLSLRSFNDGRHIKPRSADDLCRSESTDSIQYPEWVDSRVVVTVGEGEGR